MTELRDRPGQGHPGLRGLRDYLRKLRPLLADPDWDGALPNPPDLAATPPLGLHELADAEGLRAELEAMQATLRERMAILDAESASMAPRRSAARSYLQHDQLGGEHLGRAREGIADRDLT